MMEIGIGLFFTLILITATITDIRKRIIPHKIMVPSLLIGIVFRLYHHELPLLSYMTGFLLIGGLLYIIALISVDGMGGGDITLGAFVGLMLGIPWSIAGMALGVILGGLYGIIKWIQIRSIKINIPFAPFISIGALISYWVAPALIVYLEHLYILS